MNGSANDSSGSTRRERQLAYAGLAVAVLGWGGAFIAGKVALREMTAMPAAAWRFVLASAFLLPLALRHIGTHSIRPVAGPLAVMALCGGLLYPSLFMFSLERTSATNTSLIIATMPVLTLLLCPLVGEQVPVQRWLAVLVALVGASVVITRGDLAFFDRAAGLNLGDLLALGAAGVWSVFNLASRPVVATLPATLVNAIVFSLGGAVLLLISVPEAPVAQFQALSSAGFAAVLFLAVVPSGLSGWFYLHGVRVLGIGRAVVFIYCVPFVTAGLAAVVLGESLNGYQMAGGSLIFVGLVLAMERSAQERIDSDRDADAAISCASEA